MILAINLSFLAIFGALAIFVPKVRITSTVILITAMTVLFMQDSYNMLAAQGETIGLLIMGCVDLLAAMFLLMLYDDPKAEKAPEQAMVFIGGMACHGYLAYELTTGIYYFYDVYDYVIWGLSAAHILIMGGYYEELKESFKETLGSISNWGGFNSGGRGDATDKQLRNDGMDNPDRRRTMGSFKSGTYNKEPHNCKESAGHNEA